MLCKKSGFRIQIQKYILIMLVAVAISTLFNMGSYFFWIINGIAYVLLFGEYYIIQSIRMWWCFFSYLVFGIITILLNTVYVTADLKSIGMQVNLVFTPLFLMLFNKVNHEKPFVQLDVKRLFQFLSVLGTFSAVIAIATGFSDLLAVFSGRLGAYSANAAGFFYSKNIYGAFVGLTLCADVYLYQESKSVKRAIICAFKYFCVIISFSRAALLQVSIAIFLFFWFSINRSKKEWMILILAVLVTVVMIYQSPDLQRILIDQVLRLDAGDAGRAQLRQNALEVVDLGTFRSFLGIGYAGINFFNVDIDNTYYYTFFAGGIVKIAFFMCVSIISLISILKLKKKDRLISEICLAVWCSYFVFAYYESVAILEIGLLNFCYMIYMFLIPMGYRNK
ncbi:O-antigen ligase family protein [Allofournierella sp.]|uniref:O-antigen ligase family protein n=1 Tax=Allofournierella sp. TaxID=1940256 RepID=UPI002A806CF1|nr:hypothetical protein [Fournierella sp.]